MKKIAILSVLSLMVGAAFAQPSGPNTLSVGTGAGSLSITSVGSFGNIDGDNATFDNGTDTADTTIWNLCWYVYDETNATEYFLEDTGFTRTGSPYPTDGTVATPNAQTMTNTGMGFPSSAGLTADLSMIASQPDPGNTAQVTWTWQFNNSGGTDIDLRMLYFVDMDSYIDTGSYTDDLAAIVLSGNHAGRAVAIGNDATGSLNLDDGILMESVDQEPDRSLGISDSGGSSFYWSGQNNYAGIGPADAKQIDDSLTDIVENDGDANLLSDTGQDAGGVIQINITVPASGNISRSFTATWGIDQVLTQGEEPAPPAPTLNPIIAWTVQPDFINNGSPVQTQMAGATIVADDLYVIGGYDGADTARTWSFDVNSNGTLGTAVSETALPDADAYLFENVESTDTHVYLGGGGWESGTPTLWDRVHYSDVGAGGTLGAWTASAVYPNSYVNQLGSTVINDNGNIYIMAGRDDIGGTTYADCYYAPISGVDGSLGAWQTGTSLTTPAWFTGACAVENYLIVAEGTVTTAGAGATDKVYACPVSPDGSMGAWVEQTGAALPAARYNLNLIAVDNTVFAIGGRDTSTAPQDNVWRAEFDTGTGTLGAWLTVDAQLPRGVRYHDVCYSEVNDRLYVVTMRDSDGAVPNEAWFSTPLITPPTTTTTDWDLYQ